MRRFLIFSVLAGLALSAAGQERQQPEKIKVEIGYALFNNTRNWDQYLNLNNTYAYEPGKILQGVNLKFTLPTKNDCLDFVFGAIFLIGEHRHEGFMTNHYEAEGRQYLQNGGGVYAGISPKWKGKHFGLTSEICAGVFPFKEYNAMVHRYKHADPLDNIALQQSRASFLGGMAAVGFYVKFGRFSVSPSFNLIFAGGTNTSFLFDGIILPLAIQF